MSQSAAEMDFEYPKRFDYRLNKQHKVSKRSLFLSRRFRMRLNHIVDKSIGRALPLSGGQNVGFDFFCAKRCKNLEFTNFRRNNLMLLK
jgi:hypothetical protein